MNKKAIIVGILAATAVGALAALLMAPDKGSKTRKKILDKSKKSMAGFKDNMESFVDSMANKFSKATEKASQKFDQARTTATQGK